MGSQLWCYISLSRYFIQVCDMVHLFHPTFPNDVYEMQTKWEVNRGATFHFPDTSSRFAKCCTNLDPHFDMVHFFHPTFANGDSYMFNLVT